MGVCVCGGRVVRCEGGVVCCCAQFIINENVVAEI